MTQADELAPGIWNALSETIERSRAGREIVFGKVIKRDTAKKVIYMEQFGNLAIPLVALDFRFEYYDTDSTGAVQKKADPTGTNDALLTKIVVPQVGDIAVVLDPGGQHRFPLCVGVIQSTGYWLGEA